MKKIYVTFYLIIILLFCYVNYSHQKEMRIAQSIAVGIQAQRDIERLGIRCMPFSAETGEMTGGDRRAYDLLLEIKDGYTAKLMVRINEYFKMIERETEAR